MTTKIFIPITDELMYDYPELITSELTPYQVDRPCFHWSASIETTQGKIFKQVNSRQKIDMFADIQPDYAVAAKTQSKEHSVPSFWHKLLHMGQKQPVATSS